MRTKISKVAKDLNVGVNTAVEFLRKHNIEVDEGPNARIDSDAVELLMQEFSADKKDKATAESIFANRRGNKKAKQEAAREQETTTRVTGPKILGTIDLSNPRSGMTSTTASAPTTPTEKAPAEKTPEKAPEKALSATLGDIFPDQVFVSKPCP